MSLNFFRFDFGMCGVWKTATTGHGLKKRETTDIKKQSEERYNTIIIVIMIDTD